MDIWGALALILVGAFLATLIVAIFYWQAVRPRLLALVRPAAPAPAPSDRLQDSISALSESLVRHSALVSRLPTSFEVRGPAATGSTAELLAALQAAQETLLTAQQAALLVQAEQGQQIAALDSRLADVLPERSASEAAAAETLATLRALQLDVMAALEQQTADLIAAQPQPAAPPPAVSPAEIEAVRAALSDLRLRLNAQDVALAQLHSLSAAFNAAQLETIARLGALAQPPASAEVGAAPLPAPTPAARPARRDDLRRLRRQVSTQTGHTSRLGSRVSALLAALARAEARLAHHEDALAALRQQMDRALEGQQAQATLLERLATRETPTRTVETVVREEKIVWQDRLQDIKGIGPVFSGLLHEHGIHSFRQLAALTPDELRNLVSSSRWRAIDAASWIEQAALFAAQKEKSEGGS